MKLPCVNSDAHKEIEMYVTLLLGHRKYSGEGGGSVAGWSALRTRYTAVSDSSPALHLATCPETNSRATNRNNQLVAFILIFNPVMLYLVYLFLII